jgi:hypothetical protein
MAAGRADICISNTQSTRWHTFANGLPCPTTCDLSYVKPWARKCALLSVTHPTLPYLSVRLHQNFLQGQNTQGPRGYWHAGKPSHTIANDRGPHINASDNLVPPPPYVLQGDCAVPAVTVEEVFVTEQVRPCMNVQLRRVRVTIVAVDKQ